MDLLKRPRRLRGGGSIRRMVRETGAHSTDCEAPEDVDTLCDRTEPYAQNWAPVSETLWEESGRTCAGGCGACAGCGG